MTEGRVGRTPVDPTWPEWIVRCDDGDECGTEYTVRSQYAPRRCGVCGHAAYTQQLDRPPEDDVTDRVTPPTQKITISVSGEDYLHFVNASGRRGHRKVHDWCRETLFRAAAEEEDAE